ncbi:MAG: Monosaccharide-transporting ATPase [Caldanaerobacter subterraneus]|uniref:Monosaccharide ABC transporter ATP-binding protein (CUT2 family) n=2 Tax=Caldanaerobacter subterraneus TaxID=911092 RepID=A0A101E604_9THEO|nr:MULTISPECIES: sugar ABC transporter ATP-binding protein [Caldanaerobacter]ERM91385.1 D-ribose transporter ATP binding protein [Caldanaerobacter subterraneus subsp. yonseiensis KB-1]KUK09139.1 MAG: Monosaccharide-transporting ATPase [Caldanaerobacter subterraneus]MDI3518505.1 ribose transport system ATP-binding protein [Caldanaerobacter sp.]MDK2794292.1 ribose transport system ATP-binding protein [Caldanaerobacter sp.]NNG67651.1 sugar ABC transporter ATP-binding protein [Caldanaerobacter sub
MDEKTILLMKGISKSFPGVQALKNVDFDLMKGEVHGLLGENGAGKSTLIKILTGVYQKDEGEIFLEGKPVVINNPRDALNLGIAAIYQELALQPYLSVAENIFLGHEITKQSKLVRFINWKKTHEEARKILKELELDLDLNTPIKELGIGQQQMVEIAKVLSKNAKIVIMDEPTSSLSEKETEELFKVIFRLKEKGISVIYISHRLEEIFKICDRVTVMRDGEKIVTLNPKTTTKDELIRYMVGRTLEQHYPKIETKKGEEALRVENLTRKGLFENISFTAYTGEILGIAGLVGAGRTEIVRAIFGADPIDSGKIYIFGKERKITSPQDAIREGLVLIPEDRKTQGLILIQTVLDNIVLSSLPKYKKGLLLNYREMTNESFDLIKRLNIKTPTAKKVVKELSGGNQQKVVIAKWLTQKARIFIFDEPTRGIDVGAKVEIYNIMNELVKNGASVIMISSELPEILGMSDRIIVIHEGRVTAEFSREDADQEKIMKAATAAG